MRARCERVVARARSVRIAAEWFRRTRARARARASEWPALARKLSVAARSARRLATVVRRFVARARNGLRLGRADCGFRLEVRGLRGTRTLVLPRLALLERLGLAFLLLLGLEERRSFGSGHTGSLSSHPDYGRVRGGRAR